MVPNKKIAKSSARSISRRDRQSQAVQLRANGATLQQIADDLGFANRAAAYKAIQSDLSRHNSTYKDDSESVREMIIYRIDEMVQTYHPLALDGDQGAANLVMRLDKQRSELLGLDAPQTIEAKLQIDINTYNMAMRDFVGLYRDHYGTDEDAIAFAKQVNEIVKDRVEQ
jgi:hypothetical protein